MQTLNSKEYQEQQRKVELMLKTTRKYKLLPESDNGDSIEVGRVNVWSVLCK